MPIVDIPVASGAADIQPQGFTSTYPPPYSNTPTSNSTLVPARQIVTTTYTTRFACFEWNTPAYVPAGATINSLAVLLRIQGRASADVLDFCADWFNWDGTANDYTTAVLAKNAHAGTPILDISGGGAINTFVLHNLQNLDPSVPTELRFGVSQRANDEAPTGNNSITITSYEGASGLALDPNVAGNYPTLRIDYTAPDIAPAAPTNLTATIL